MSRYLLYLITSIDTIPDKGTNCCIHAAGRRSYMHNRQRIMILQ